MQASKYQKKIYETYQTTGKNLVIGATAGSGKSTTLIQLARITPPYKKVAFFAFNKSIADELTTKLPKNVYCSTIHSLGAKSLFAEIGHTAVQEGKSWQFINRYYKNKKVKKSTKVIVFKLIELYRMYLCTSEKELMQVAAARSFTLSNGETSDAIKIMAEMGKYNDLLMNKSLPEGEEKVIDFTDMLYLTVKYKVPVRQFDVVMIDEGQDLNKAQMALIEKSIKVTGRFVLVGDDKQAIYQFAGSELSIFESFQSKPNTETLPLSITYRCAKNIVLEAQNIFGEESIEFAPDAPEGIVKHGDPLDLAENGDFVLCRNNKPLVQMWIDLTETGKKAYIYGSDLAEDLERIIDEVSEYSWPEALDYFQKKTEKIVQKLTIDGYEMPKLHPKVTNYLEKVGILGILHKRFPNWETMKSKLKDIFKESGTGVVLISIHKAKGLESDRVFFHLPELIPSKFAKTPQELYAEQCLKFVAITRAKTELIYC